MLLLLLLLLLLLYTRHYTGVDMLMFFWGVFILLPHYCYPQLCCYYYTIGDKGCQLPFMAIKYITEIKEDRSQTSPGFIKSVRNCLSHPNKRRQNRNLLGVGNITAINVSSKNSSLFVAIWWQNDLLQKLGYRTSKLCDVIHWFPIVSIQSISSIIKIESV